MCGCKGTAGGLGGPTNIQRETGVNLPGLAHRTKDQSAINMCGCEGTAGGLGRAHYFSPV